MRRVESEPGRKSTFDLLLGEDPRGDGLRKWREK
jgi:hypothetical protein